SGPPAVPADHDHVTKSSSFASGTRLARGSAPLTGAHQPQHLLQVSHGCRSSTTADPIGNASGRLRWLATGCHPRGYCLPRRSGAGCDAEVAVAVGEWWDRPTSRGPIASG